MVLFGTVVLSNCSMPAYREMHADNTARHPRVKKYAYKITFNPKTMNCQHHKPIEHIKSSNPASV